MRCLRVAANAARWSLEAARKIHEPTARGVLGLSGLHVLRLCVHLIPFAVLLVLPHPSPPLLQPLFVAPFWRKVQPVIRADEYVQPASVARICVEDVAGPILVEHARAGPFLAREFLQGIVVVHLALLLLFLAEIPERGT